MTVSRLLGSAVVICLLEAGCGEPTRETREASPLMSASGAVRPDVSKLAAFVQRPRRTDAQVIELGRILFFDPRLSLHNDMSCATCHDPAKGWSDGRPRSVGHLGKVLARNAPSVINPDSRLPMFWDGRARTVEEQALGPITNADEMAQPIAELLVELGEVAEYTARFAAAFPGSGITADNIASAIAEFERMLVSADAPLDRWLGGDESALTPEVRRGLELFVGKARCTKCHEGAHLTDASFHNIGVSDGDDGRFKILALPGLKGAFKTPGLRDVALTAPYMHDGSVATLEAVVDLYARGGDHRNNLDADIVPLQLDADEKAALVAFMKALTGKSPTVVAPPIPRDARASKQPLRDLMKEADGMLGALDRTLESLNESNWSALAADASLLLHNAEDVSATRTAKVKHVDSDRFHLLQGRLILAVRELAAAASRRARGESMRAYTTVRERCDDCHEVFNPAQPPHRP